MSFFFSDRPVLIELHVLDAQPSEFASTRTRLIEQLHDESILAGWCFTNQLLRLFRVNSLNSLRWSTRKLDLFSKILST
jgi:hypothetical protein